MKSLEALAEFERTESNDKTVLEEVENNATVDLSSIVSRLTALQSEVDQLKRTITDFRGEGMANNETPEKEIESEVEGNEG